MRPRREGFSFATARDGARDFDGGDAGDVDHGGWTAARDAANPGGAGLLDVAFDQSTGIDEVCRCHLSAARG